MLGTMGVRTVGDCLRLPRDGWTATDVNVLVDAVIELLGLRGGEARHVIEHHHAFHAQPLADEFAGVVDAGGLLRREIVIRHLARNHDAASRSQQGDNAVDHRIADIVEEHVVAIGARSLEVSNEI
jgi:hypothetical protein